MISEGSLAGLGAGDRYAVTLGSGDRLEGSVLIHTPLEDFAGTVENLGDGLFRFGFEECFGIPQVHMWLSTWGAPSLDTASIEKRWTGLLDGLFGADTKKPGA